MPDCFSVLKIMLKNRAYAGIFLESERGISKKANEYAAKSFKYLDTDISPGVKHVTWAV